MGGVRTEVCVPPAAPCVAPSTEMARVPKHPHLSSGTLSFQVPVPNVPGFRPQNEHGREHAGLDGAVLDGGKETGRPQEKKNTQFGWFAKTHHKSLQKEAFFA